MTERTSKEILNLWPTLFLGAWYLRLSLMKNKIKTKQELHNIESEIEDIVAISFERNYDDRTEVYKKIMRLYQRHKDSQSVEAEAIRNAADYFYKKVLG